MTDHNNDTGFISFFQYDLFDSETTIAEQVSQRALQKTSQNKISFITASKLFSEDEIEKMFYRIEERLRNIDENTQGPENENKHISPQEVDISLDNDWLKSILPPSKVGKVTQLIQKIIQLDTQEAATKMADFWLSFPKIDQHQHVRQVHVVETGTATGVLTTLGGTYLSKNADQKENNLLATRQILTELDMFGARLYVQTLLMYGLAKDWFVQNRLDLRDAPIKKAIVDKLVGFPTRHGIHFPYSRHIVLSEENPGLSLLATQSGSMSTSEQGEQTILKTKIGELVGKKGGRFNKQGAGIWYAFSQNAKFKMSPDQINYMAKMTHSPETEVWRGYRNPYVALINTAMTPGNLARLKKMIEDASAEEGDRKNAILNALSMPGSGEYVGQFYLLSELFIGGALMYANSLESLSYIQLKSGVEHPKFGGFLKWPKHTSCPPERSYPDDERNWLPFFFSLVEEDRVSHPQRSEEERLSMVKELLTWCGSQRNFVKVPADIHQVYACNKLSDWSAFDELNALDINLVWGVLEKKGNFLKTKTGLEQMERVYSNNIENIKVELLAHNSKTKKPSFDLSKEKDRNQYELTLQIARCFEAPLQKLAQVWMQLGQKKEGRALSHYELIYKIRRKILSERKMPERVLSVLSDCIDYERIAKENSPISPETKPLVDLCEHILDGYLNNPNTKLGGVSFNMVSDDYSRINTKWRRSEKENKAKIYGIFVNFFLNQVINGTRSNLTELVNNKVIQLSEDAPYLMESLDRLIQPSRDGKYYLYEQANALDGYLSRAWEQVQNSKAVAEAMMPGQETPNPVEEISHGGQSEAMDTNFDYGNISF